MSRMEKTGALLWVLGFITGLGVGLMAGLKAGETR